MSSNKDRISLVERAVKRMQEDGGETASRPIAPKAETEPQATVNAPEAKIPAAPGATPPAATATPTVQQPDATARPAAAPPRMAPPQPEATPAPEAVPDPAPAAQPGSGDGEDQKPQKNFLKLDLDALRKKGMITPSSGRTHLVEEMRGIKRPLLKYAFSEEAASMGLNNVVMVSSCQSGEGKTFTAINLAMSIAMELDLYVLLIDADIYRRGVCEVLEIEERPGLVDLALDEDKVLSDFLLKTNIPNLSILQAGTFDSHATELLASQHMIDVIKDISSRYPDRIVIIDTPPVLASSEPRVLAGIVGQVVTVVEEGTTTRQLLDAALAEIADARRVSFILNKHRRRKNKAARKNYYYYEKDR